MVLCEAIQSISRWQLIKCAFPHILYCGSVMLREKLDQKINFAEKNPKNDEILINCSQLKFSQMETKLLYTLHWILLDAAFECEDAQLESTSHSGIVYKQLIFV